MKPGLINIGDTCRDLATQVSVTGRWSEYTQAQSVSLTRGGDVGGGDIDRLLASFEAKRIIDDDNPTKWPRVSYILRLCAVKDLVREELPTMAKVNIEAAEVSVSNGTLVIASESMRGEEIDESEFDTTDDDNYTYERFIQYILDKDGHVVEYTEGQGYAENGEDITTISFLQHSELQPLEFESARREERVVEQRFTILEDGIALEEVPHVLKAVDPVSDIRSDLSFADFLAEYSREVAIVGHSVEEHQQRIMAMMSFITLQSDATTLIKTAFA